MDKLNLLAERKAVLFDVESDVKNKINEIIDENSFVELDRFSYSKNEFYSEDVQGEGVVTGFATINDFPCYIVAQNSKVLNGGLSYAGAQKICKCLDKACASGAPVIYLFSSLGVLAGEGVSVLEGCGMVLSKMQELRDIVPQFSIAVGDVYGSSAIFASTCDYNFLLKDSCVAYASPVVLSAKSGKSLDKESVGGVKALANNGVNAFGVESLVDCRNKIVEILEILPQFSGEQIDCSDDFNRSAPSLNEKACAKCLISAVYDNGKVVELGKDFAPEVVTCIGRIGGFSVASIIFNGENGVELNANNIDKIQSFIYYAQDNNLPLITFVNTLGIEQNLEVASSLVMRKVANLSYALSVANELPKINVIYGKAIGLGYTLFGSRAMGADYSFAFANASISPFDVEVGAQIEFGVNGGDIEKLKAQYAENEQDAMNAAKNGFIDNVIEPEFVRQYIISALQMLL